MMIEHGIEEDYRAEWIHHGAPIPLEVIRSRYDDDIVSWEVCWHNSLWNGISGSSEPIAEFTTWAEAHEWAERVAREVGGVYRIGRDRIVGPLPDPWGHLGGYSLRGMLDAAAERMRAEFDRQLLTPAEAREAWRIP